MHRFLRTKFHNSRHPVPVSRHQKRGMMSAAIAFPASAETAGKISAAGGIHIRSIFVPKVGIIRHQCKNMLPRCYDICKIKYMRGRQRFPCSHKLIIHPEHRIPQTPFQKKGYILSRKGFRHPYSFLIPCLSHIGIFTVQISVILFFRPLSLPVAVRCSRQPHQIRQFFQIPRIPDSPAFRIQREFPVSI